MLLASMSVASSVRNRMPVGAKAIDNDLGRYLRSLMNFARDEIRAREALGRLEPGQLQPEDIVDEAIAHALDSHEQPTPGRAYPWLRNLVRRAVERYVRSHPRHRSLFEPVGAARPDDDSSSSPRALVDIFPDPSSPVPEQLVESLEFQQALASILRQLPTSWREPFLLHVRDGLSLREVSQLEGVPPAEVRQRIERAREFLRARLADEYAESPLPAPTESLFELVEGIEPTAEHLARTRARLDAAA
jgi:RNA polymerase sigma factor (sigma-70 family)